MIGSLKQGRHVPSDVSLRFIRWPQVLGIFCTILHQSGGGSPSASLSLVLIAMSTSCLGLLRPLSIPTRNSTQLKIVELTCILSLRDHCPLLPITQHVENHVLVGNRSPTYFFNYSTCNFNICICLHVHTHTQTHILHHANSLFPNYIPFLQISFFLVMLNMYPFFPLLRIIYFRTISSK